MMFHDLDSFASTTAIYAWVDIYVGIPLLERIYEYIYYVYMYVCTYVCMTVCAYVYISMDTNRYR